MSFAIQERAPGGVWNLAGRFYGTWMEVIHVWRNYRENHPNDRRIIERRYRVDGSCRDFVTMKQADAYAHGKRVLTLEAVAWAPCGTHDRITPPREPAPWNPEVQPVEENMSQLLRHVLADDEMFQESSPGYSVVTKSRGKSLPVQVDAQPLADLFAANFDC